MLFQIIMAPWRAAIVQHFVKWSLMDAGINSTINWWHCWIRAMSLQVLLIYFSIHVYQQCKYQKSIEIIISLYHYLYMVNKIIINLTTEQNTLHWKEMKSKAESFKPGKVIYINMDYKQKDNYLLTDKQADDNTTM